MFDGNNESVSKRVKDLRTIRKVQQDVIANYLEIKRSTYQNREKNGSFKWEEITLIADFFDESPFFIKYGVYDDELAEVVHKVESITRSALEDFRFSIFDNDLDEQIRSVEHFASYLALAPEEKERIEAYVKEKNL